MTITARTSRSEYGGKRPTVPGLGPLESAVMLSLWDASRPLKVAEVGERLDYHKEPAYTTVMTILNILCRKGLARRLRIGRAWRYTPALSRDDYLAQQVRDLISFARNPTRVIQHALTLARL
jgi:predicted transcriptional regulator